MPEKNTPSLVNEIDHRLEKLRGAFMRRAEFQGLHFRYAAKNGETFIEIRRDGRYYLWLLCDDGMKLIDATVDTRLPGGLAVVGEKKLGQSAPISS